MSALTRSLSSAGSRHVAFQPHVAATQHHARVGQNMRIVANGIESIGTRLLLRLIAAEFSYLAQSSDLYMIRRYFFCKY